MKSDMILQMFADIEKEVSYLSNPKDSKRRIAIERFAERIVRKCAVIAKTAEPWQSYDLICDEFGLIK